PLVRQAASRFAHRERAVTGCQVCSDLVPPGDYPFAIYQWRFLGLQEDSQLQPITLDERVRTSFTLLLSGAGPLAITPAEIPSSSVLDQLEAAHYSLWSSAR